MRWRIVSTLLWKEALRFRYNWGLLVMVGAVLALSALVSLGGKMGELPGQTSRNIKACAIALDSNNATARRWSAALLNQEPNWKTANQHIPIGYQDSTGWWENRGLEYPRDFLIIELIPPVNESRDAWHVRYFIPKNAEAEALFFRFWVLQVTQKVLGNQQLVEDMPTYSAQDREGGEEERLPKIVTALVIFAFYLLSFNLYITSTAEEREKKALLALLLSPARPMEVIGAKVLFYASASLLVSCGVVGLFDVKLLAQPLLWSTILAGSISYVCIGTVVLCWVQRQSTINTVSMMYLLAAALVMSLSVFLVPFAVARHAMVENYLFHQLEMIIGGRPNPIARWYQPALWGLTVAWFLVAVAVFQRRGMAIAHVKR
jgi:hypothetical protein